MDYRCEDLPRYGVVLVPPSSPDFTALLVDIQTRLASALPGRAPRLPGFEDAYAPTMILLNRSHTAIAALSLIWKYEPGDRPANQVGVRGWLRNVFA